MSSSAFLCCSALPDPGPGCVAEALGLSPVCGDVPFVKVWLRTHPVTLVTEERDHPPSPPLIVPVALYRESELFCALSSFPLVETTGTPHAELYSRIITATLKQSSLGGMTDY